MTAQFGTSGLRGLAGDLLDGTARTHVAAFLRHLLAQGVIKPGARICLARDMRASSPALLDECAVAVAACGLVPVNCGLVPTPALALHAMAGGQASIMVTGSHIPADRNGIKFYRPDGEITKADEAAISAGAPTAFVPVQPVPAMADEQAAALARYAARCRAIIAPDALAGLRIGVWQHSSVARDLLCDLVAAHGATALPLRRSDSFVPVDTDAVDAATLAMLAADCAAHRLDAIISTDADGDRPLILDETGTQVRGDVAGILTARLIGARTSVTPVTSNSGIERALGVPVVRTRVGSPFVIAAMDAARHTVGAQVCGFEANGGFLVGNTMDTGTGHSLAPLMTRDSALPILAVLGAAARAKAPLSALIAALALPVMAADRLQNVPTHLSTALVAELTGSAQARSALLAGLDCGEIASIDTTDGLRMITTDGTVIHLRPSGNAPEMRCYVEMASEAAATAMLHTLLGRLRQRLQS